MAVDSSNNVIVAGIPTAYGSDYVTIKYSSEGVPLWTNHYNGRGYGDNNHALAVAVDGSNNVIVTGYSDGDSYPRLRDDRVFQRGCAALDQSLLSLAR